MKVQSIGKTEVYGGLAAKTLLSESFIPSPKVQDFLNLHPLTLVAIFTYRLDNTNIDKKYGCINNHSLWYVTEAGD